MKYSDWRVTRNPCTLNYPRSSDGENQDAMNKKILKHWQLAKSLLSVLFAVIKMISN